MAEKNLQIPFSVLKNPNLSGHEKLIYALIHRIGDCGEFDHSDDEFMEFFAIKRKKVRKALSRLKELEMIRIYEYSDRRVIADNV